VSTTPDFRPEVIPQAGNEIVIELSDEHVDSLGRRQFTAHWLGYGPRARGFDYGHRGQVFYARVDEYSACRTDRGYIVRVVGPFPRPVTSTRRSSR
jgi:hypothetical protein